MTHNTSSLSQSSVLIPPSSLYVVGGQQRTLRPLLADEKEWYEYQKGLILEINPATGDATTKLAYVSPPAACAPKDPEILFKSGYLDGTTLYACTQTEVILFHVPSFEQIGYISLPCFNDVHHVRPAPNGNLIVANSGLDMVLELTHAGEIVRLWNTLGEDPWARFSPTTDYRQGISTKPHRSHPNHLFCLGDDIWATRFQQKDALCLTQPERRIEIGLERVHDGVVHQGHIYFTSVDGKIIVVSPTTLQIEQIIDLPSMHDDGSLLGWCRSLCFVGDSVWVGFSRIRPTKFRENVGWIMHGFKHVSPTHIACYDLVRQQCVSEINLEPHGLSAVFSIFPAVQTPVLHAAVNG